MQKISYLNELFKAAAWEDAVQLWPQSPFREQRKNNRLGDETFEHFFSVNLSIKTQQHLRGFSIFGYAIVGQLAQVDPVAQSATATHRALALNSPHIVQWGAFAF